MSFLTLASFVLFIYLMVKAVEKRNDWLLGGAFVSACVFFQSMAISSLGLMLSWSFLPVALILACLLTLFGLALVGLF